MLSMNMRSFAVINKYRAFVLIVLAGILIRMCFLRFSDNPSHNTNAFTYDLIARSLAEDHRFAFYSKTLEKFPLNNKFPPVYPLFLAAIYSIDGYHPEWVPYFHLIIYVLACVFVFKLALLLFNRDAAIWGTLFFSIEPVGLYFSLSRLPEVLITFLLPASIYFLIKFLSQEQNPDKKYKDIVIAGIITGIAILTKPVIIYFPLVMMAIIAVYLKKSVRKMLIVASLLLSITGLSVLPWFIRNKIVFNKFEYVRLLGYVQLNQKAIEHKIYHTKKRYREEPGELLSLALKYFFGTATITIYESIYEPGLRIIANRNQSDWSKPIKSSEIGSSVKDYLNLFRDHWKFALLEIVLLSILLMTYLFAIAGIMGCD